MTSVRATNSDHVDARSWASRSCLAGLRLQPSSSARGAVDGAWWPRSTDPAIELATLIEAVGTQRAPVQSDRAEHVQTGQRSSPNPARQRRKIAVDWVLSGTCA